MEFLKKYSRLVVAFVFCVAIIAVYKTFDNISAIFGGLGRIVSAFDQVIIGFIIAYILNMPIRKLEKGLGKINNGYIKNHRLGLSIAIVYLLLIAVITISLHFAIPALMKNIRDLYYHYHTYIRNGINFVNKIEFIKKLNIINEAAVYTKIESFFGSIDITTVSDYASGVYSFTSGVLKIVVGMVVSIYMLVDSANFGNGIKKFMSVFMNKDTADWILNEAHEVNTIFTSYFFSRVICCVCLAGASLIAFPIIGVKYWPVMALFIGICDLIPYFGSIIGCVVIVVVNLILSGNVTQTIVLGIVLLILEQLDGNVLTPKVMSSRLEVRPLTVICGVLVGGNLFGAVGVIISVPIICIVKGLYEDIVEMRLAKKQRNQENNEPSEISEDEAEEKIIEDAEEIIKEIQNIQATSATTKVNE